MQLIHLEDSARPTKIGVQGGFEMQLADVERLIAKTNLNNSLQHDMGLGFAADGSINKQERLIAEGSKAISKDPLQHNNCRVATTLGTYAKSVVRDHWQRLANVVPAALLIFVNSMSQIPTIVITAQELVEHQTATSRVLTAWMRDIEVIKAFPERRLAMASGLRKLAESRNDTFKAPFSKFADGRWLQQAMKAFDLKIDRSTEKVYEMPAMGEEWRIPMMYGAEDSEV